MLNKVIMDLDCTHTPILSSLTHWGRVTHICVSKLTITGSHNDLSPRRRQAIIWTNAGILLIGPLETNFSEILSKIHTFSFKKMHLKTSSAKLRPFCLGLNVLRFFHWMINLSFLFWTWNITDDPWHPCATTRCDIDHIAWAYLISVFGVDILYKKVFSSW